MESVGDIVNDGNSSTVTIKWTPPTPTPTRGYRITTTPDPISPTTVNTNSTSINITVNYNINYTVTVSSITCDGLRETSRTFSIGMYVCTYIHTYVCENYTIFVWLSSKLF